jgi:NADH-quinone oxidoreductase subunit N
MNVETGLSQELENVLKSVSLFVPELLLTAGILLMVIAGLIYKNFSVFSMLALAILGSSFLYTVLYPELYATPVTLFYGMARNDGFSACLRILIDVGGILSVLMSWQDFASQPSALRRQYSPEYYAMLLAVVLGAHLLVMSVNLLMVFISLELISIASYVLTGFLFDKRGTEGSLKYFFFGSSASAVMLYGFSVLYGFTGTLDFSSPEFIEGLLKSSTPLFFIAGMMAVAGFLYKIAAAPLHPWAPDVYESAPMPVVAFFSVVPKLAGIGVLTKFILALNLFGRSPYDWQAVISVVAILTLTVGNFSALLQKSPKRLMAYSSIAQSGFLLVGIAAFLPQGIHFMLFYASVYLLMNFLVFMYLHYFEMRGTTTIASYQNAGSTFLWPSVFLLVGLVALTGLPPTAGFTAKLFIFTALWEAYHLSGKQILLWLLIIGLLNTVISLFYYLRIPYYSFIKSGESGPKTNNLRESTSPAFSTRGGFWMGNLFGFVLVILVLLIFFIPDLLMGWINKINFVL